MHQALHLTTIFVIFIIISFLVYVGEGCGFTHEHAHSGVDIDIIYKTRGLERCFCIEKAWFNSKVNVHVTLVNILTLTQLILFSSIQFISKLSL